MAATHRALLGTALMAALLALAQASHRSLLLTDSTDHSYKEVNWTASVGSPEMLDISYNLVKTAKGLEPEQVSVTYWTDNTYLISWVTGDSQVGLGLCCPDPTTVNSTVYISTSPDVMNTTCMTFTGSALTYHQNYSGYVDYHLLDYCSGIIHHTVVEGLNAGTTYYYIVGDNRYPGAMSKVYNFTTLPNKFPVKVAVTADTGQTVNTTVTIAQLLAFSKPDLVVNVGDLAYVDTYDSKGTLTCRWSKQIYALTQPPYNFPIQGAAEALAACQDPNTLPPTKEESPDTYQPRFDSWARLWEQVFAYIPTIQVSGNHELDLQPDGTLFEAYNARYPQAQYPDVVNTQANNYFSDRADNNMYSLNVVPGVATIFMLNTFQPQVTFGSANDKQFAWFKERIAKVDRSQTPWLLVNFHFPIYTSDPGSFKYIEQFRVAYEPLFYQYGVDLVFNGHIHAYERSHPVYNHTYDNCGPVHIVVGSGGNDEGLSSLTGWVDEIAKTFTDCTDPYTRQWPNYQPQRFFTFHDNYNIGENPSGSGYYCPSKPANWVAYREQGFGAGLLTFMDANTAKWEWHRNQAGAHEVTDSVTVTRQHDRCNKQRKLREL